jgi:isorenieratene synthase
MMFDVFSHSFFNPEEQMSAAELLMMFHYYFLANSEGLVFDVLGDSFDRALLLPLCGYLEERGVRFVTGRRVISLSRRDGFERRAGRRESGGWLIQHVSSCTPGSGDEHRESADFVVLSLNVQGLRSVVDASPELGDQAWRAKVRGLGQTSPFAVWRLWLDQPIAPDRHAFAGTAGFPLLDNISLFHLFEEESRAWAERTGGSVVELHAYGMPESATEPAIRAAMQAGLHALYPETSSAAVVHEVFRVDRDCPAFPPGGHARRPGVETPELDVALAGDHVRLEFPTALMERATASGFLAASVLLRPFGVRPEPLGSVSPRGPLA